jgi:RND family efflux transporter MFP subunit
VRRAIVSVILIVLFLALGAAALFALISLKEKPDRVADVPPRTAVRVVVAEKGPYREILEGYGSARAIRASEVAAEVSGTVRWLSPTLEAGAVVTAGDELVRLDPRDFRERVSSAEARAKQAAAAVKRLRVDIDSLERRLAMAREDLDAASRELDRVRGLVEDGVETKSAQDRQLSARSAKERIVAELEWREAAARNDLIGAEAEVEAASAALAQAKNDLARTTVAAPYSGRIEARSASLGARVGPGTPLFRMVDLSRVEVPVALGASRYGEVAVGARAAIRLTEGGPVVWRGPVARVSPSVNSLDRTFLAYLEVSGDAADAPVPPGAFVLAEIEGLLHEGVIALPRAAFVEEVVYVADPADGEAVIREVRPEVFRTLPNVALVTGGVEPGDRVVVTSLEQIAAGSRVILVDDGNRDAEGEGPRPGGAEDR